MMADMNYRYDPAEQLRYAVAREFSLMCKTYFQRNMDGTCAITIMVDNETDLANPVVVLSARALTMKDAYESLKPRLMLLAK